VGQLESGDSAELKPALIRLTLRRGQTCALSPRLQNRPTPYREQAEARKLVGKAAFARDRLAFARLYLALNGLENEWGGL